MSPIKPMRPMGSPCTRRSALLPLGHAALLAAATPLFVAGCTSLPGVQAPRVQVVGVERLRAEGAELRLALKLRLQNPNVFALDFEGLWLELDVNGRPLATGLSSEKGSVPAFGEFVLTVPVTVSMSAAMRQVLGLLQPEAVRELPYVLRGRISGGPVAALRYVGGGISFVAEGSLKLPS